MYTVMSIVSVYLLLLPYFTVNKDVQTSRDASPCISAWWVVWAAAAVRLQ